MFQLQFHYHTYQVLMLQVMLLLLVTMLKISRLATELFLTLICHAEFVKHVLMVENLIALKEPFGHFQCGPSMVVFLGVHCLSIDGLLAEHCPCPRGTHSGDRSGDGFGAGFHSFGASHSGR